MIVLCSGISTKFSLAELELDSGLDIELKIELKLEPDLELKLAGEEFMLDKTLTLEDKEAE